MGRADVLRTIRDAEADASATLAKAESSVHGTKVELVHFHEIGSIDSLVDITGVCAAVEYLSPHRFICDHLPAGSGFVDCFVVLLFQSFYKWVFNSDKSIADNIVG